VPVGLFRVAEIFLERFHKVAISCQLSA
jgi:hypothetical protein